jgi:1-acyl-sn-glycerol-3-phosphate acyltransferase
MKQVAGIFGFLWKVYVGVIFMILALFFYPIIFPFLYSDKNRKRAFNIFVIWSWAFRIFGGYFVKRVKTSKLPKGPYLVVANHASYLDIFLMFSLLPRSPFLF